MSGRVGEQRVYMELKKGISLFGVFSIATGAMISLPREP